MKTIFRIYMLVFAFLVCFSSLAQTEQVNVSLYPYKSARTKSKIKDPDKIFKFSENLYTFFTRVGATVSRDKDNPEMFARLSDKFLVEKLGITEPDGDYKFQFIAPLGQHIWFFATQWDEKTKMLNLFNWVLNPETLAVEGQPQLVLTIDESKFKFFAKPEFKLYYSPDSSKMLVTYQLWRYTEAVGLGFAVLNNEGKLDWYSPDNLRPQRDWFYIEDCQVNNKGEVFLVQKDNCMKDFLPKRKGTKFNLHKAFHAQYILSIVKIVNEGKNVIYYEPELPGMYIAYLKIGIRNDNQMVCAGLYCVPGTLSVIGVCTFIPDKDSDNKMVVQSFDFDFEYIIQDMDEDRKEVEPCFRNKLDFECFGYFSNPLIFRKDNSFWFLTEQYSDPGTNSSVSDYYWKESGNVNVFSFSADGKLEWKDKLVKQQKSQREETEYTGIYTFVRNEKLYILYNNLPSSGRNVRNDETSARLATFDRNGTQSNQELFSFEEKNLILLPNRTTKFSVNRIVAYGYNVHISDSFVELTFE